MLIFKFAGNLRRFYRQVSLNVDTPAQGLRLLLSQNHEFKKAFLGSRIRMRVAGDEVTEDSVQWHMDRSLKDGSTVLFVPVIEGAISGTVALVATLVIAAASVAYSIYMARNMKTKNVGRSGREQHADQQLIYQRGKPRRARATGANSYRRNGGRLERHFSRH